jgi:hypothetical protein
MRGADWIVLRGPLPGLLDWMKTLLMTALNPYEEVQVREIAFWKSELPSLVLQSYRGLCRPFSKLLATVVPKSLARKALDEVQALSQTHESAADILKESGASQIGDLLGRSLEECDRLSKTVSIRSEHLALLEGVVPAAGGIAIPGVGGAVTAIADVPLLLEASLRAIRRVGHCYGFPLDSDADRRFVLAILDLANEDEPISKGEARLGLWNPDGPPERAADGSGPAEEVEQSVTDDVILDSVPFLGDLSNLVLDYAFVRRADIIARRVFQERWLRANGKVESIPPSPETHRRSSLEGVANVGSELVYVSAYGVSFGATFTATLASLAMNSVAPEIVKRGLQEGASAASRDSHQFLEGFGNSTYEAPKPKAELASA